MDTGPRIFKCGDLIILLRPFFALFYFGFIFHAVDQNRGDLLRVSNVLLRSCTLSCTNCCVSRCEQMLQIFRQFFFLTFSDSALPDVIMIGCGETLNTQANLHVWSPMGMIYRATYNESNGELAVACQVLVVQALVYYDFKRQQSILIK